MSHYLGLCASFKGKNDFSNFVSVQQLDTLIGRRSGNVDKIPCGSWVLLDISL